MNFSGYSRVEGTYGIDGDRLYRYRWLSVRAGTFYFIGPNSPVEIIRALPLWHRVQQRPLRYSGGPLDSALPELSARCAGSDHT